MNKNNQDFNDTYEPEKYLGHGHPVSAHCEARDLLAVERGQLALGTSWYT